jgi:hypothetical protein
VIVEVLKKGINWNEIHKYYENNIGEGGYDRAKALAEANQKLRTILNNDLQLINIKMS